MRRTPSVPGCQAAIALYIHAYKQGWLLTGIVEHVVVMGAPVSTRLERWAMARSVVAGRFVNTYSRRDWVLGLIYRGANGVPLP